MKIHLSLSLVVSSFLVVGCGGGGSSSSSGSSSGPSQLDYPTTDVVLLSGVAVDPLVPTVKGKVNNWSVTPKFPAGVKLSGANGAISGTPTVVSSERQYTITASNDGGSAKFKLRLRTAPSARWGIVPNIGDNTVSSYGVDAKSGNLFFVGHYEDPQAYNGPEGAIAHPTEPFVYVPNLRDASKASNLSIFTIDASNGQLTPHVPVDIGVGPHRMAMLPSGTAAYVTSNGSDEVKAFLVDQGTGDLLPNGPPAATGNGPWAIAVDPLERFVFVANRLEASISIFHVDAAGGLVTPGQIFSLNGSTPNSLAITPNGRHLVATVENFKFLLTFSIAPGTGNLQTVDATSIPEKPSALAIHPKGEVIYVVNRQNNDERLTTFSLDPLTGGISAGTAIDLPKSPNDITLDEAGFTAYVSAGGADELVLVDLTDPLNPTVKEAVRTRESPQVLGLSHDLAPLTPRGEALYVLNDGDETVSAFGVEANGLLSELASPVLTGSDPTDVVVDPFGDFLWVANEGDDAVQAYVVDGMARTLAASGAATAVGSDPAGIAVDPTGSYLFVTTGANQVESYLINQTTGELIFVEDAAVGADPGAVAVDPTGQFIYIADRGSSEISAFRIDDGRFVAVAQGAVAQTRPEGLAFSPNGAYLYATLGDNDGFISYGINSNNGDLIFNPPGAAAQFSPMGAALHPTLDVGYVALNDPAGMGGVATYTIDPDTGKPSFVGSTSIGLNPIDLSIDPLGGFLYAANQTSDDVTVFAIGDTGELSVAGTSLAGDAPRATTLLRTFD